MSAMAQAPIPGRPRVPQRHARTLLVERLDLCPVHAHPARHLGDALVEQGGQPHVEVEQARPGLVADAQQVGEALVDEEQRALAVALQECVGRDRGSHLDLGHGAGWDRRIRREPEHLLDAGDRGRPCSGRGSR